MPDLIATPQYLDDSPAERDALDFAPYVETLAAVISSPRTNTPITIGVFGSWGSGKTSLLRMIRASLPEVCVPVWFDAWKYDRDDVLWRALLVQVLAALGAAIERAGGDGQSEALAQIAELETALYRPVERESLGKVEIDGRQLFSGLTKGALQVGLGFLPGGPFFADLAKKLQDKGGEGAAENLLDAVRRERTKVYIEQVRFLEQFQGEFQKLVARFVVGRGGGGGRLVVFVDDLDRCLPEKAVSLLEAIKLFLDVPGALFVLGLDRDVIVRAIERKYQEAEMAGSHGREGGLQARIDGHRYLEKIIQIPFELPPIDEGDLALFVTGLVDDWPDPGCPGIFAAGLGGNPRQVKRAVNVFLLLWRLAAAREKKLEGKIRPLRLAKVVALQHAAPELYQILREQPRLLAELEQYCRAEEEQRLWPSPETLSPEGPETAVAKPREIPQAIASFAARAAVRQLLSLHTQQGQEATFSDLPPEEIRLYFTLTRRTEAPEVFMGAIPRILEPQLIHVPSGLFLMGSISEQGEKGVVFEDELPQHEVALGEYWIGKYPVTQAEYQVFVREAGAVPPTDWDQGRYQEKKGEHPVVLVSLDEALAYCRWLSEVTGKNWMLPSEAEWEKAARGTDGRIYPWGDRWDPLKLNSKEKGLGTTTPVGRYSPEGDSPFGIVDAAGNVWEWTRSLVRPYPYLAGDGREEPKNSSARVVRGGSFGDDSSYIRCAVRLGVEPIFRHRGVGFRVVVLQDGL